MIDMATLLRPSNLKIDRAEHYINNLSQQIAAYLEKRPFRLMTKGDADAEREFHFIKQQIPIPVEFALTIGDAVHNLRGALDILVFGMIGARTAEPEMVQFPFARDQSTLDDVMISRETLLAGEKVVTEIKRLEPYSGGNKWLIGVHEFNIADKHKLVIPVASIGSMSLMEFTRMLPDIYGHKAGSVAIQQGANFVSISRGVKNKHTTNRRNIRSGEYERDFQPLFDLCFDEDHPFAGQPVIPTLKALANHVREAALMVAKAFLS
jgi:hypothetical protein